jgi:hypothetical protein
MKGTIGAALLGLATLGATGAGAAALCFIGPLMGASKDAGLVVGGIGGAAAMICIGLAAKG